MRATLLLAAAAAAVAVRILAPRSRTQVHRVRAPQPAGPRRG